MNDMQRDLPDFGNPPVVEVALAVQYDPLEDLRSTQLGLLWLEFKDRFPKTEEHPPLGPMVEEFGDKRPSKPELRVEMLDKPPTPRLWYLDEAGTELVQVQQDRFAHNWRKLKGDENYPRYEHIKDSFVQELTTFSDFLGEHNLGKLIVNLSEVTYVNHIFAGDGWDSFAQLNHVLTLWSADYSDSFLPDLEEARLSAQYIIPNDEGTSIGRLLIEATPAYRTDDNKPVVVLRIRARAKPYDDSLNGALRSLDTGRAWVVRGFASITTATMHRIWERRK